MLSKKVENSLNKQIELEANASQFYLAMASWAETKGFEGVASFFYRHSNEERDHMLKLIKYVNERGGHAIVPSLPKPPKVLSFSVSLLSLSLPTTPPPNPLLDDSAFTALFFPINTFLNAAGDSVSLKSIKYPKHFPLETSEFLLSER